jgi:uncharacterized membrane protein
MKVAEIKEHYKHKYMLSTKEIVTKTIILRIISSLVTAWLVYVLTGSLGLSQKMFWIDFCVKMFLYFFFELGWFKLRKLWT